MRSFDKAYRSFAPLRMTCLRFAVILSGAKDLYVSSCRGPESYVRPLFQPNPLFSVKNQRFPAKSCGLRRTARRLPPAVRPLIVHNFKKNAPEGAQ